MGDDKKPAKQASDGLFKSVQDWITKAIGGFVAALFLILGIGMVIGFSIAGTQHSWIVFIPFALAFLSYYNRDFALVGLVAFIALFFI